MVRGMNKWQEFFAEYTNNYVLIGGAACSIYEEEYAQTPRATKDLDIILIVEALSPDFGERFWKFIHQGKYTSRQRGENKHEYFRFLNPLDKTFPQQIEIFARKTNILKVPQDIRIEPIHIDDALSSLSAILMDDEYYNFTINNCEVLDNINIANTEALICLKAKAFNDLQRRKADGEKIDSRDIDKHKKDILRLSAMLSPNRKISLPTAIHNDMQEFIASIENNLPSNDFIKAIGLNGVSCGDLLMVLRTAMG